MSDKPIFQFYPFKSCVDPSFWYKLSELKIDQIRLSEVSLNIFGYYSNVNTKNCLNFVDFSSFNSDFTVPVGSFRSHGVLINKNTIEDFKNCNKNDILDKSGQEFWQNIRNGTAIEDPSLLSFFVVLSFADLKNHNFYFWFAFPACTQPVLPKLGDQMKIDSVLTSEQLLALDREYFTRKSNVGFFIVETSDDSLQIKELSQRISAKDKDSNFQNVDLATTFFCFADPCEYENAGWVLRNFIVLLMFWCPKLRCQTINVVSLRVNKGSVTEKSLVHKIVLPAEPIDEATLKWVGWERNDQGNFGPKVTKLGDSMDPMKLAANSVNLNLKLMKWRLMPDLNLDIIANAKCLLIGAGTLGCGIARSLLAWGCNHITFIDSGTVSYSNPVRQYLYTHKDAVEKRPKATAAEERVREIHPGTVSNFNLYTDYHFVLQFAFFQTSKGHIFDIPMPGHPIGDSLRDKTTENIGKLVEQIDQHDIVFLLTDSRESRWLPTMLGKVHKKVKNRSWITCQLLQAFFSLFT
jgi:ubiquitin-like modifier-activating enzyme ATG7